MVKAETIQAININQFPTIKLKSGRTLYFSSMILFAFSLSSSNIFYFLVRRMMVVVSVVITDAKLVNASAVDKFEIVLFLLKGCTYTISLDCK